MKHVDRDVANAIIEAIASRPGEMGVAPGPGAGLGEWTELPDHLR